MANLTIPTNLYPSSYSGLGSVWQNFGANQAPKLESWLNNYDTNVNTAYNQASQGAGNVLSSQIAPAIQQNINGLAGRGMLNSTVAGDVMSKTMTGLAGNHQANAMNLNANRASALLDLGKQLMAGGAMGQYSESSNKLAPYQTMAELIYQLL